MRRDVLTKALSILVALALSLAAASRQKPPADKPDDAPEMKVGGWNAKTFEGLSLRGIGPAVKSGRIADLAVDPGNPKRVFVAVASGGVWKTENAGTTWTPLFDKQGSYSVGCVTLDPKNPFVVWVGSGENNSQRSVGYGDGVYRSEDGGKTWKVMGLKASEHIGKILVDPRDSGVVYVAAQGPLWAPGGDRGLFKTTDGGATWTCVLKISENTGVNEVVMDPRNPDVLLASSYQRRRHVWGLLDGGPEGAIYKSTDAGAHWRKVVTGLPKVDLGRIGLAVSPASPDVVYAIVEAAQDKGGFFRSTDRGETWEKRGDLATTSAQYYNEIIADPKNPDRVYVMDTWMKVTEDGGKTFRKVGEHFKHVDNHALWIDPADTSHLLAGCDGGLYETWDRGETWRFTSNLPVTQFYKVTADNASPFYFVYGGTQDNNTLGGPSQTPTENGITNRDWFVTVGGDGFKTQVDPEEPWVVYSQSQYGGLARYDRKSGEISEIQPQPAPGEAPLRFNWSSPLIISPHSHTRLYFAAQRVLRSDDRGATWRPVSGDLTRQIDRSTLPMMGRVWSVDSVARNDSTSFYGNVVSLAESPRREGLLYAGTDDGLIQVTEDGGATWRKQTTFPGVPDGAYVSAVLPSLHDENVVYASFDNHKAGDFRPYVLVSGDRGRTWRSAAGDLPARGTVWTLAQDDVKPGLLFAGTEFGLFFTPDGGTRWVPLKGGLPTVGIYDLDIQRREGDLVAGSFGRGIFILDDYSPLRLVDDAALASEAVLFPVKKAWMYVPGTPLGLKDKSDQGDAFFMAPNPPFGAVFTYYLKEDLRSLKEQRLEREKELLKAGKAIAFPSWDALRAEDLEEPPAILLTVTDEDGAVVRRLEGPVKAGFQRVAWDLRYPAANPSRLKAPEDFDPWAAEPMGPMAAPGTYFVTLSKRVAGKVVPLGEPRRFECAPLGIASLAAPDREAVLAFQRKVSRLQRAVLGASKLVDETQGQLDLLKRAADDTPGRAADLGARARELEVRLKAIRKALSGDRTVRSRNEPDSPSIVERVQGVVYGGWTTSSAPTQTHLDAYAAAAGAFGETLADLRALVEGDLRTLQKDMEKAGAPWTPGRVPEWSPE